jgi:hypothetical protein
MKNCHRTLPALLVSAAIAACLMACGSSSRSPSGGTRSSGTTVASTSAAPPGGYIKDDGDKDGDDPHPTDPGQDDQSLLATYGHRASTSAAHTISALVKHYYAAALAGDGAQACALLDAGLAAGLISSQSQTKRGAGACAAAVAPLLAQQHQHLLAEDPATMTVTGVYVNGNLGLALLGFRDSPETDIVVEREGHAWKIGALIDSNVP